MCFPFELLMPFLISINFGGLVLYSMNIDLIINDKKEEDRTTYNIVG